MVFTKEEKGLLKVLVEKEIANFKADVEKLMFVNANYITKEEGESDFDFLKLENKYHEFLESLLKKLE